MKKLLWVDFVIPVTGALIVGIVILLIITFLSLGEAGPHEHLDDHKPYIPPVPAEEKPDYKRFARHQDSGVTPGCRPNLPDLEDVFVGNNSWYLDKWLKENPEYQIVQTDSYGNDCGLWDIYTVTNQPLHYYYNTQQRFFNGEIKIDPYFNIELDRDTVIIDVPKQDKDCPCEDRIKALEDRVKVLEDNQIGDQELVGTVTIQENHRIK